jgi:hypothetical protein
VEVLQVRLFAPLLHRLIKAVRIEQSHHLCRQIGGRGNPRFNDHIRSLTRLPQSDATLNGGELVRIQLLVKLSQRVGRGNYFFLHN